MASTRVRAFTLIELLVVVTIIVILLALLTPALDKALYQAALTQCGATHDAMASSTITYAMAQRRSYPQPRDPRWGGGGYQPDLIGWEQDPPRDMRITLDEYVVDKMWHCPLSPDEMDYSHEGNDHETQVFANYYYFPGWKWIGSNGGRGLLRMGDRLSFIDKSTGESVTTRVMVSSRHVTENGGGDQVTHPDKEGVMTGDAGQNRPFGVVVLAGVGVAGAKLTQSVWHGGSNDRPRGPVDLNYAMTDGSVIRFNDVELWDERLGHAPAHAESAFAVTFKLQVPRN